MTRLTVAIPSKGRLKENAEAWLKASGFTLKQVGGGRGYRAVMDGLPDADVMLLSAREIAEGLISGALHIGVTGEDLLHDLSSDFERDVHLLRRLGFGGADVIVAVPAAWLDVDTMADLEAAGAQFRLRHGRRMRVATKYLRLTRRFFAAKSVGEYRLVESAGATEAAPAAGSAEVVVDITSTGATLKANGLKILADGVILKSQASAVASKQATWSDEALASLRVLLDGVEASAAARQLCELEAEKAIAEGVAKNKNLTLLGSGAALCSVDTASDTARWLTQNGYGSVVIKQLNQVYLPENAILTGFLKNLS